MEAKAIDTQIMKDLLENGYNISPERKLLNSKACELGEITDMEDLWINLRLVEAILLGQQYMLTLNRS